MIDGANIVTLSLTRGANPATARRWLIADAIAPLVGIVAARSVTVTADQLAVLLALFAGFFLYIGASDLLPRSQAGGPRLSIVVTTALGFVLIYGAVRLAAL
jgi:zinc transporter ZupT